MQGHALRWLVVGACLFATCPVALAQQAGAGAFEVRSGDDAIIPVVRSLQGEERLRLEFELFKLRTEIVEDILKIKPKFMPRLFKYFLDADMPAVDTPDPTITISIAIFYEKDTPQRQQISCNELLGFAANTPAIDDLAINPEYRDLSLEQVLLDSTKDTRRRACEELQSVVDGAILAGDRRGQAMDALVSRASQGHACSSVKVMAGIYSWNHHETCSRQLSD
jgi:hypothetical protein